MNLSHLFFFNKKGGTTFNAFAITLTLIVLISGLATIYYQYIYKDEFSEEEIQAAQEIAQSELNLAFSATENYPFDQRIEAIQSIGYDLSEEKGSEYIFEKHNEKSEYYILLRLKPHDSYKYLTRVLIQIFDKENGSLITEVENVLTWKSTTEE